MPKGKKAVEEKRKVEAAHIDEIWDTINEIQQNLDFINDKLKRILDRMGLE
tara:strand:+ start:3062 stop:3214 length:153 start_codon:yes stop_codon:yes gene_type:complete